MTVYELNRDQLTELKQHYYAEKKDRDLSYEELANIDVYVSDREVRDAYYYTDFVPDDFSSSAGEDYEDAEYSFGVDLSGTPEYIAEQLRLIASDIENGSYGGLAGGYGASWGLDRI